MPVRRPGKLPLPVAVKAPVTVMDVSEAAMLLLASAVPVKAKP